jgi:hypothetical protein
MKAAVLTITFGFLVALGTGPVRAQDPADFGPTDEEKKLLSLLRTSTVSVDFQETPVAEALAFLSKVSGVRLDLDPMVKAGFEASDTTLTFRLKEVPALTALRLALRMTSLAFEVQKGGLYLTTPDGVGGPRGQAVFPVGNLIRPLRRNPGVVQDIFRVYRDEPQKGPGRGDDGGFHPTAVGLADFVRDSVNPDTWDVPGHRVAVLGDNLLVSCRRRTLRKVRDFLRVLQWMRGPHVHFHVRVLGLGLGHLAGLEPGTVLREAELGRLAKAAAGMARPFGEYRLSCLRGERIHLVQGKSFSFVRGLSSGSKDLGEAQDGVVVDVRPLCITDEGLSCFVRVFLAAEPRRSASELARLPFLRAETALRMPLDRPVVAALGSCHTGEGGPEGFLVLLTAKSEIEPDPREQASGKGPEERTAQEKLSGIRMDADFQDTPFAAVLIFLARISGVNIILDPSVPEEKTDEELLVHIKADDVSLWQVLELACRMANLRFMVTDGIVHVVTHEAFGIAYSRSRAFPIGDLVALPLRPGPDWTGLLPGRDDADALEEEDFSLDAEALVNLVRENVEPESWDCPPFQLGSTLGHLTAVNTPEVLDRVASLLGELRGRTWKPVAVSGLFLRTGGDLPVGPVGSRTVLDPAACDVIEEKVRAGKARAEGGFGLGGILGQELRGAGGRQVVLARSRQDSENFQTVAGLDGWSLSVRVLPGVTEGRFLVEVRGSFSTLDESAGPPVHASEIATQVFRTRFSLRRGEGALLGGGAGAHSRLAGVALLLRLR